MTTDTVEDRFRAVGFTLKDEFRVDRVVAEGGFGLVYQATHVSLDRPVAIKVLKTPEEYNENARRAFVERFKQEARTVLKVKHPAVVQVLDFGASTFPNGEEAAWTAMEWVEGTTLEDELRPRRKQGGRHPIDVMALLRPVIEAVAVAHDEGIAHRDLKPANIMVVRGRRAVTVRLLDFGIAKLMDPGEEAGSGRTRTASQMVACSPRYAAPEQISSARTGPWSDVHALAMILSEMLTDRPGYVGKDATSIFAEALSPTRPTPAKRSIDVGAWEAVLAKATAIRPDDRYLNAGALLAALDEALPRATHPTPPGSDVVSAITALQGTPVKSVTSPEALAQTAASVPDVRPPATSDDDDDDDAPAASRPVTAAPSGPVASGPFATPPPPLAGTQAVPGMGGTQPLAVEMPSTGSTTLRGVSTDSMAAPAPVPAAKRGAMPIMAVGMAIGVVAALAFTFTRGRGASPTPAAALTAPRAPAPPPVVAPTPAHVVAPVAAPVAVPVAAPIAAPVAEDAGAPAAAVAPVNESAGSRRRSHRSRRTRSHGQDYNVD
jgi:serine/threonine protein kinase